jgi:hypothetical protein
MKMIIGLVGKKRSGKSYLAQVLTNKYNLVKIAYADELKEIIKEFFNIELIKQEDLDADKKLNIIINNSKQNNLKYYQTLTIMSLHKIFKTIEYNDILKSKIDTFANYLINIKNFDDLRKIYQYYGTDLCRYINNNLWIDLLNNNINKIINKQNNGIIIDDIRFENELNNIYYISQKHNLKPISIYVEYSKVINNDTHDSEQVDNLKNIVDFIYNRDTNSFIKRTKCSFDFQTL